MRRTFMHRFILVSLLALVAASCDGIFGPEDPASVPESSLTFIRVAPDAPPLVDSTVTFWAVRGKLREAMIRYEVANGYDGKCLLFRVPAQAIPAGAAPGDSVKITIRVAKSGEFRFEFAPAGLRFDPAHPAELEVRYRYADPDYNRDGVVDQRDDEIANRFAFWRQERPGEDWTRVPTNRRSSLFEAHARVTGFTQYALATDRQGIAPETRSRAPAADPYLRTSE